MFDSSALETLLNEDSFQMHEELIESLEVTIQTVLLCLKGMGIVQNY